MITRGVRTVLLFLLSMATGPLLKAASTTTLTYTLAPQLHNGRMAVHVTLEMSGANITELILPSAWGDAADLKRSIINLATASPNLTLIDTADPSIKRIHSSTRGKKRISYDLVNDWSGPLRESVRHHPHIHPAYVEFNTSNGLIHPKLDKGARVKCEFVWKLPPAWSVATSFGAGSAVQRFLGQWDDVQNALFVAGDFQTYRAKLGSGSLTVAIRGALDVPHHEIAKQVEKLVRIERAFWKDDPFPYYLVTVVPFDAGQSGTGGGGYTNAFSLHLSQKDSLSEGALSLMAHEVFHAWNPYRLGRMPDPSESIYWFTEGFTTYYQDLLLLRAGLLSLDQYIQTVNRFLRDYTLSPAKNAPMQELIERSRKEQAKGRISYERGATIALWLDSRIREHSQGRFSLDSMMFDLLRTARVKTGLPDLTYERVLQAASRYISTEDSTQLRTYVESGSSIEAPASPFGPCVTLELVDTPSFELGMDRTALVDSHKVSGLEPGSNAQKSGLQNGDTVVGTSIYWNDTSKPIKLTVRRNLSTFTATYHPIGPSLGSRPRYTLNLAQYQSNPRSCDSPLAIR